MKNKPFLFALFLGLACSLFPVGSVSAQENTQVFSEADNGKTITLAKGERVEIALEENEADTLPWVHCIWWRNRYKILLGEQHDDNGHVTYDGVVSTPTYDANLKLIKTTFSFYGNQPGQFFISFSQNWAIPDSNNASNMIVKGGTYPVKSMISFFVNVTEKVSTSQE